MFEFTEEKINEIIENYGGSKKTIKDIVDKLNSLDIYMDEDDYYEIVAEVVSQKETMKEKIKSKRDVEANWVSTDKLILYALREKFCDLSITNILANQTRRRFR